MASNPLPIGVGTVIGRSAQLGADHSLGTDVTLGRGVIAGARLTIAAGGTLGYGSTIGDDVTVGADAIIGNLVSLGDFTSLGDNAVVARGVTVADAANSAGSTALNGVAGPDVAIGAGARIEQGARVRKQADIGAGAAVEGTGRVGRGAIIGAGATVYGRVGVGATLGAGATVGAGATIGRGAEVCEGASVPDNAAVGSDDLFPPEGCQAPVSCKEVLDSNPSATSGVYTIDAVGTGPKSEFDAYCDMTTAGGGWTLVHRKQTASFYPITTSFVPNCATNIEGNCASAVHPSMVWDDALFRFGDSDNLALKIPSWDAAAQDAMSGSVLSQSVNTGVVRYIANVEQPQQTIQLTVRTNAEQGYVSEIYAGTDQYLNLWAAYPETTSSNLYTEIEPGATRGQQCIAGYCRSATAWFMVR